MPEKPIIFSTPMVQAILEGKKTQTRRVAKRCLFVEPYFDVDCMTASDEDGDWYPVTDFAPVRVGDVLWVREKWCNANKPGFEPDYYYFADTKYTDDCYPKEWKWRPSIHMPRAAARIFLQVVDVRVERVQDVTEESARAEGVRSYWLTKEAGEGAEDWHESNGGPFVGVSREVGMDLCLTRRDAYKQIWNDHNAGKGFSWDVNPWVWVYEFKRYGRDDHAVD